MDVRRHGREDRVAQEAVKTEKLSKRYRIGAREQSHDTLLGAVTGLVSKPAQNLKRLRRLSKFGDSDDQDPDTIWAIKDVSFTVNAGEALGIIGHNGAGKSTLLKILSRITSPTTGRAKLHGRVSSLLEVGTGFHPELTGRENVYMNGTILGMSKKEIDLKFGEIVDFSGIEKFIDTPVKRYSSGMNVRLAFSVAASLEPEILIVDEVLAVGDAEFQKKCLGKLTATAGEGRTVVFVSHNLTAVTNLCHRALLMESGKVVLEGDPSYVISSYLDKLTDSPVPVGHVKNRSGDQRCRVVDLWFSDSHSGARLTNVQTGRSVDVNVKIEARTADTIRGVCNVHINNLEGQNVFTLTNLSLGGTLSLSDQEIITYRIPEFPLLGGDFVVSVYLAEGKSGQYTTLDHVRDAVPVTVIGGDFHGNGHVLRQESAGLFTAPYQVLTREGPPAITADRMRIAT